MIEGTMNALWNSDTRLRLALLALNARRPLVRSTRVLLSVKFVLREVLTSAGTPVGFRWCSETLLLQIDDQANDERAVEL